MDNTKDVKSENIEFPSYLFHQGTNYRAYEFLGAHFAQKDGKDCVLFRTWAPNAESVSVVGDFNNWDDSVNVMERITNDGVFEAFVFDVREFDNYSILKQGQKIVELPVWLGMDKKVDLLVNQDILRTIKKSKVSKVKLTAIYDKPVKAPIKQGDKLGFVRVEVPGADTVEVPLIANKEVKKLGWFGRIGENIKYLLFGAK